MSQLVRVVDDDERQPLVENMREGEPIAAGTPAPTAESELLRRELTQLYNAFVQELNPPEAHQIFFKARFEERLTQVEAGRRAGLSHMQARTLEKKLRKRFLGFMQARGYFEGCGDVPAMAAT
jgi:DNA-directed RNA polymerase specialized sigma subunit